MPTYKVLRLYADDRFAKETIETNLSFEEARARCNDPDSSSKTCKSAEGKARTRECGEWFEAFYEE